VTRTWILPAALFCVVFLVYVISPIATPFDSRWTIHTALSLIHEHNADLNEYEPQLKADGYYAIECVLPSGERVFPVPLDACAGGRLSQIYPVTVPLIVAPAVALLEGGLKLIRPLTARTPPGVRRSLLQGDLASGSMPAELIIASAFVALAAVVLFCFARTLSGTAAAVAVSLAFAFATPAWSTGSRALWMHGFSMLLLPAGLWCAWKGRWLWAGVLFSLAFFVRPTNAVPLLCAGLWALWCGRREVVRFTAGTLPVAAIFCTINFLTYASFLSPYARLKGTAAFGLHARLGEALLGNLFSPARGLFVFSPVLLFSLAGIILWIRNREMRPVGLFLASTFAIHYFLMSCYADWFGGHSYGPRYMSDLSSLLAFALLPAWPALARGWRAVACVALAASLFIHSQGAWCWPCVEWNSNPVEISASRQRLWDWSDPPFLRGFKTPR